MAYDQCHEVPQSVSTTAPLAWSPRGVAGRAVVGPRRCSRAVGVESSNCRLESRPWLVGLPLLPFGWGGGFSGAGAPIKGSIDFLLGGWSPLPFGWGGDFPGAGCAIALSVHGLPVPLGHP